MQIKYSQQFPLVLPCRPSSPKYSIGLELQNSESDIKGNGKWMTQSTNTSTVSFNPKVGYTLTDTNLLNSNMMYLFRCFVESNEATDIVSTGKEYAYFNVTKESTSTDIIISSGFQPRKTLRNKATATLMNLSSATIFRCCSDVPSEPPKLYFAFCLNKLQCNMMQDLLPWDNSTRFEQYMITEQPAPSKSACVEHSLIYSSTFVLCKGSNIDFAVNYISIIDPLVVGAVSNRSERLANSTKYQRVSLTKCKYLSIHVLWNAL